MEILKRWGDYGGGLYFLGKYAHVLAGICWIGLLYFFNFVQVPAYAELSPAARGDPTAGWQAAPAGTPRQTFRLRATGASPRRRRLAGPTRRHRLSPPPA